MYKNVILLSSLLLLSQIGLAQVGSSYPSMTGKSLTGKTITLAQKGKVSLVALAYSPKSEEYLKNWRKPLFDLFIEAPGTDLFSFEPYDANIKFVVLLTGAKKMGTKKVFTKLEENVEGQWKEHILVVKGKSLKDYSVLDLGRKKSSREIPYFFLMDASGKIVYATSGSYTSQKQKEIEEKLTQLIGDNQFQDE